MHLALGLLLLGGRWAAIILPASSNDEELAQNLSDVLVARLAQRTHAEMVGREELHTQLGLSDRGVLGCAADTPCLGRVATQLKVERMVVGTASQGVGDEYILNLNLIVGLRTERSELRKAKGLQALVAEVQALADEFSGGVPAAAPKQPPELGQPAAPRPQPARYRTAAGILSITGGALTAVGILAGLAAKSKADDLQSKANVANPPVFDSTYQMLQSDGRKADDAAKALIGAGVVAGVTGLVLFWVGRPVGVSTDGKTVAIVGRF
jgi:hypothetical protein